MMGVSPLHALCGLSLLAVLAVAAAGAAAEAAPVNGAAPVTVAPQGIATPSHPGSHYGHKDSNGSKDTYSYQEPRHYDSQPPHYRPHSPPSGYGYGAPIQPGLTAAGRVIWTFNANSVPAGTLDLALSRADRELRLTVDDNGLLSTSQTFNIAKLDKLTTATAGSKVDITVEGKLTLATSGLQNPGVVIQEAAERLPVRIPSTADLSVCVFVDASGTLFAGQASTETVLSFSDSAADFIDEVVYRRPQGELPFKVTCSIDTAMRQQAPETSPPRTDPVETVQPPVRAKPNPAPVGPIPASGARTHRDMLRKAAPAPDAAAPIPDAASPIPATTAPDAASPIPASGARAHRGSSRNDAAATAPQPAA